MTNTTTPTTELLVHQGGQFYAWDGACWPAIEDAILGRAYIAGLRGAGISTPPQGAAAVRADDAQDRRPDGRLAGGDDHRDDNADADMVRSCRRPR